MKWCQPHFEVRQFLHWQKLNVLPINYDTLKVDVNHVNAVAVLLRKSTSPLVQVTIC